MTRLQAHGAYALARTARAEPKYQATPTTSTTPGSGTQLRVVELPIANAASSGARKENLDLGCCSCRGRADQDPRTRELGALIRQGIGAVQETQIVQGRQCQLHCPILV